MGRCLALEPDICTAQSAPTYAQSAPTHADEGPCALEMFQVLGRDARVHLQLDAEVWTTRVLDRDRCLDVRSCDRPGGFAIPPNSLSGMTAPSPSKLHPSLLAWKDGP